MKKHCSSLSNDPESLRGLHGLCRERLKDLGISASRTSKSKSRHFPATPGKKLASTPSKNSKSSVFGRPLRDLAPTSVEIEAFDLQVPHFLVSILSFLRNHLDTHGIFRKAGSAQRQRALRVEVEEAETFFVEDKDGVSPLDVGSLLKQWLRELPEPLIPIRFHEVFLRCCKLTAESKIEAVLTSCLLLPPLHAAALSTLMRFLSEVADSSSSNKMDARSLAIVFTPSLFPVNEDATNIKKVEQTNMDLANKLDIVETLIRNSNSVCMIDQKLDEALNIPTLSTQNSDLSDDEDYESYAGGPSARRMKMAKKTKRRSGSLSRVFTATMKGLHKAIRSTTPAGIRTTTDSSATPIFQSPRLPVRKRKVSGNDETDSSPNSKHRKAALESNFTPKVMRARSVSIKNRFKRKKSLTDGVQKSKEPTLIIHQTFEGNTPLPNKPRISSITNTPGTPASMGLAANRDLSNSSSPILLSSASARSSKSSLNSIESTTSTKSYPGRVVKRKNSDRRFVGKPRSPSERKIGLVRRRNSQEMERKKALLKENLPISDKTQLKRGRPNTFRIKPSPMKVEKNEEDGRKTTRIKISFDQVDSNSPQVEIKQNSAESSLLETSKKSFRVNESLSNLRQDISSMIEKSFGPFQDPEDAEIIFKEPENSEKFSVDELTLPKLPSMLTRSSMRRQSSAFEIKSKTNMSNVRRQSSAFELAALANKKIQTESFNRGIETRASLKTRNSSVKDLVKKLEVSKPFQDEVPDFSLPSPPKETPLRTERGRQRSRIPVFKSPPPAPPSAALKSEMEDMFPNENEWMDANAFFKDTRAAHLAFEETSGCKRSSIIRIRTEKKGLVSRSVDTFSKPALPPPMMTPRRAPRPPARTPSSSSSNRRTSARLGVAGITTAPQNMVTRRQTLTGIRTSATQDKRNSSVSNKTEPIYGNIESSEKSKKVNKKKRSKIRQGERFKTIGYEGEVRSPLRDKKNTLVTVQRSKSAQTHTSNGKIVKKAKQEEKENEVFCLNVQRSLSLRSPRPNIEVPASLKETIYDVTTPKSEKVKRHLSDRVVTPRGGRQDAVPFIKDILAHKRANGGMTPNVRRLNSTAVRKSPRLAAAK